MQQFVAPEIINKIVSGSKVCPSCKETYFMLLQSGECINCFDYKKYKFANENEGQKYNLIRPESMYTKSAICPKCKGNLLLYRFIGGQENFCSECWAGIFIKRNKQIIHDLMYRKQNNDSSGYQKWNKGGIFNE